MQHDLRLKNQKKLM